MSAAENFQFFSGSSSRARKRRLLLFLRKVQKELADHRAVARQVPLEAANIFEAFFPDVLRHQRRRKLLALEHLGMHAHDQHLFVIRAVENPDVPALGQMLRRTPQEIMLQFGLRWHLERVHLATLRDSLQT